jgi:hypothetical protein
MGNQGKPYIIEMEPVPPFHFDATFWRMEDDGRALPLRRPVLAARSPARGLAGGVDSALI